MKSAHSPASANNIELFISRILGDKEQIDADLRDYSNNLEDLSLRDYGEYPAESIKLFTSMLSRGGKRLRGSLVMLAYEACGGRDKQVSLRSARVMEMLQAYILILDDVQDSSEMRRGSSTAHVEMRNYHLSNHLKGSSDHFGMSIALCASALGFHEAMQEACLLQVEPKNLIRAISSINKCYSVTGLGQTLDIFNEVVESVDQKAIENVLVWKTSFYTFVGPLQFGALLAGADESLLQMLQEFGIHAGKVFQVTDDIIGVFSDAEVAGKSPLDDIKEGKRTILSVKAIELATSADAFYLKSMLGNKDISMAEFMKCREIIESSGALAFARNYAEQEAISARKILEIYKGEFSSDALSYLLGAVDYMLTRKS